MSRLKLAVSQTLVLKHDAPIYLHNRSGWTKEPQSISNTLVTLHLRGEAEQPVDRFSLE